MTYPDEPPRWPTRTHTRVHVVRWRYPHWTRDRDGLYRWHTRWFAIGRAATRFADRLRASGAIVHRDTYSAEFVHRIDENAGTVHGAGELEETP